MMLKINDDNYIKKSLANADTPINHKENNKSAKQPNYMGFPPIGKGAGGLFTIERVTTPGAHGHLQWFSLENFQARSIYWRA